MLPAEVDQCIGYWRGFLEVGAQVLILLASSLWKVAIRFLAS
jgi:hypothetical protein